MKRSAVDLIFVSLAWLLCFPALGFVVSLPSPHGMASFFFMSLVAGAVGAIAYPCIYFVLGKLSNMGNVLFGLIVGVAAFLAAALLSRNAKLWPTDYFQWALLLYLIAGGAAIGLLSAKWMSYRRRASESA